MIILSSPNNGHMERIYFVGVMTMRFFTYMIICQLRQNETLISSFGARRWEMHEANYAKYSGIYMLYEYVCLLSTISYTDFNLFRKSMNNVEQTSNALQVTENCLT